MGKITPTHHFLANVFRFNPNEGKRVQSWYFLKCQHGARFVVAIGTITVKGKRSILYLVRFNQIFDKVLKKQGERNLLYCVQELLINWESGFFSRFEKLKN
jgi:hypothetical protein